VKLHDLKPAPGSHIKRIRVGRGIAAGKGKTAGRGTKGQKARAGGTIPAWFEGGQTPAHMRLPKLHGFTRRGRIEYQVVNVGRIDEYALAGRLGSEPGDAPLTVNSQVLLGAGLISTERKPVKILGTGEVTVKLFVAAEAFTKSARAKIEAAGGFVQPLAPPKESKAELQEPAAAPDAEAKAEPVAKAEAPPAARPAKADAEPVTVARSKPAARPAKADAEPVTEARSKPAPRPAKSKAALDIETPPEPVNWSPLSSAWLTLE